MYNQSYEEYMQDVLGYPTDYRNTYPTYPDMPNACWYCNAPYSFNQTNTIDLEELYPDIYRIVYPMVQNACMKNTKSITKDLIDDMVNEIYNALEPGESINLNINLANTTRGTSINTENKTKSQNKTEVKVMDNENRGEAETRHNNFLLNDLIRILIIRELLGRPSRPGNRPPMRPQIAPQRPPFPGNRPPIMPRDFDANYGIYEY